MLIERQSLFVQTIKTKLKLNYIAVSLLLGNNNQTERNVAGGGLYQSVPTCTFCLSWSENAA